MRVSVISGMIKSSSSYVCMLQFLQSLAVLQGTLARWLSDVGIDERGAIEGEPSLSQLQWSKKMIHLPTNIDVTDQLMPPLEIGIERFEENNSV